jgi:hypothetical protein
MSRWGWSLVPHCLKRGEGGARLEWLAPLNSCVKGRVEREQI